MKTKMTVVALALSLGNSDRISLEQSLPLHNAYRKAKDEDKAATRLDFIVSYLEGNLKIGKAAATKIAEKERDSRTTVQQQSYDRARSKFGYHIERAKPGKPEMLRGVWKQIAGDITAINSIKSKLSPANRVAMHKALAKLVKDYAAKVEA